MSVPRRRSLGRRRTDRWVLISCRDEIKLSNHRSLRVLHGVHSPPLRARTAVDFALGCEVIFQRSVTTTAPCSEVGMYSSGCLPLYGILNTERVLEIEPVVCVMSCIPCLRGMGLAALAGSKSVSTLLELNVLTFRSGSCDSCCSSFPSLHIPASHHRGFSVRESRKQSVKIASARV